MEFQKTLPEKALAKDLSSINDDSSFAAQPLSDSEILAVAGGPEILNEPEPE